jgi:hypothetical protein
MEYLDNITI